MVKRKISVVAHVLIPTLGKQSQEGCDFEVILAYIAKPCLKTRK